MYGQTMDGWKVAWLDGLTDKHCWEGWMDASLDGWMDGQTLMWWMEGWMDGWTDRQLDGCQSWVNLHWRRQSICMVKHEIKQHFHRATSANSLTFMPFLPICSLQGFFVTTRIASTYKNILNHLVLVGDQTTYEMWCKSKPGGFCTWSSITHQCGRDSRLIGNSNLHSRDFP